MLRSRWDTLVGSRRGACTRLFRESISPTHFGPRQPNGELIMPLASYIRHVVCPKMSLQNQQFFRMGVSVASKSFETLGKIFFIEYDVYLDGQFCPKLLDVSVSVASVSTSIYTNC